VYLYCLIDRTSSFRLELTQIDRIGPYTLKGKDGSQIDFMCLAMIDPESSWFEMVELPVMEFITPIASSKKGTKTHKTKITKGDYFDKTSTMISHLINKTWFSQYPHCQNIIYDNGCEFKLHFKALCDSYGIVSKTLKRMLYWNVCIK
jgi:hypothetical protein